MLGPGIFGGRQNRARKVTRRSVPGRSLTHTPLALRGDRAAAQKRLLDAAGRKKIHAPENQPTHHDALYPKATHRHAEQAHSHAPAPAAATAPRAPIFEIIRPPLSANIHKAPRVSVRVITA